MFKAKFSWLFCHFLFVWFILNAQSDPGYQQPPKNITDIVMASPTPGVSIDDKGEWMLISERSDFPGIEQLAEPELRIAGLRINPENFGPSRSNYSIGFQLKKIQTGETFPVKGLPENLRAANTSWSPDQKQIAFTHTTPEKITLWKIDIADKSASQLTNDAISDVLGTTFIWAGNDAIIYKALVKDLSQTPAKPKAPSGPVIQENLGKEAASRTYQDLIKNQYDEALFEFYATTQLKRTDGKTLGAAALYNSINLSPDNRFILTDKLKKPFSYLVPANGFAKSIEILDAQTGSLVKEVA
ncbi:MAG: S9 family peptidase, partial [Chitinophagaceae bacterium]|nr:S9 family peptidase [Chitinophagaceae bacterium]